MSKIVNTSSKNSDLENAYNNKILNLAKYNGRVNLMDMPDPDVQFKFAERVAVKNKATEYRGAIAGEWEDNLLSRTFFSAENIQIIQNGIRAGVYKMSKGDFTVMPQNPDTIKIIMRSIYMQYAEHYPNRIREQIEKLNGLVLNYAVPNVFNEAVGYIKYREDISSLVVPLDLPTKIDRDYKQHDSSREFFMNTR
jgi:hypothetical protein